jgi:hypothetical protein
MTKTTISNIELFNRIRRLRREVEESYRAGRWQDAMVRLIGRRKSFATVAGSGSGTAMLERPQRPACARDRQRAYRCRQRADGNGYATLKPAAVGSNRTHKSEVRSRVAPKGICSEPSF